MSYRLRNLILAVTLAVLAALMTAMYVTNYERRVDNRQERVEVFVASKDFPPGTSGSEVGDALTKREVPRESVAPSALSSADQLNGQVATQWTYAGEQVTLRRFAPPNQSGIRSDLKGTQRALEVTGTVHQLLAGTLKVGDHVDVLANFKVGNETNVTRVMLRDILVLEAPSLGGIDAKVTSGPNATTSAILRLTDAQAHKLFFVTAGNEEHEWWLDLRSPTDATDGPESVTTLKSALRDGLGGGN